MPIMSEMGQGTKGNSQCTKEEDVIKQEKPSPEAIVDGLKNPHQQSGVELQQAKEENEKEKMRKTVRTRICMISDTHTRVPLPENSSSAYRWPLPKADILLHAGDITMVGYIKEYEEMIDTLTKVEAELKIVIAGNHDITLDENFYEKTGKKRMHRNHAEDLSIVRELWTGDKAKQANIFYLEEGTRTFVLKNGARFTIYTSPWQPEFCNWAFNYPRSIDRYNQSPSVVKVKAANPVPSWPEIDIMLTHGPPHGILDTTRHGERTGCDHLRRAVQRCRPRIHCFGHIHEGYGAEKMKWSTKTCERVTVDSEQTMKQGSAYVDLTDSDQSGLEFGDETLFVNASILDRAYRPVNAPWVVDIDLPLFESSSIPGSEISDV